jgi:hypothetical protein
MLRVAITVVLTVSAFVAPSASAFGSVAAVVEERARPLEQAHAHNDYEHARPLFDALDHGFTSVEADIWPVNGELWVAHDPEDLRADRTLQSLYLDPLADIVRANHGRVYQGKPVLFQLLVDIKLDGVLTYGLLDSLLREPRYAFMFSHYVDGKVRAGAVTVVISGDQPRDVMAGQSDRLAFYDGRILNEADLGPGDDASLVPLVSDNWTNVFTWTGEGPMPAAERARLHEIVATAHAADQRVRFWATPDAPGAARDAVWSELLAADVNHINTDDLAGLEAFLRQRD